MPIDIIDNFRLLKNKPLDTRFVVENVLSIPGYARYDGMMVYQTTDKTFYKYIDGVFSPLEAVGYGVSTFNSRSGNIVVLEGAGISISEISSGNFEISVEGVIRANGSVPMNITYIPQAAKDVATKEYVDESINTKLNLEHADVVASFETLGHIKIDDDSIKINEDERIYINKFDGGSF